MTSFRVNFSSKSDRLSHRFCVFAFEHENSAFVLVSLMGLFYFIFWISDDVPRD